METGGRASGAEGEGAMESQWGFTVTQREANSAWRKEKQGESGTATIAEKKSANELEGWQPARPGCELRVFPL